jgi:sugar phosphate isomerase/epimerase
MIFISTGGYKSSVASNTAEQFLKGGIKSIELSGGTYSDNLKKDLLKLKKKIFFQVHNYFPPAELPFVFNLASTDEEISKKSYDHAINAINWAQELGGTTYSFHSGFLIDPKPEELGKKINKRNLYNREHALEKFIFNVNRLSDYADSKSISLLIENNVLSNNNIIEFDDNPLLMTSPLECKYVMENTDENVNLLIDVAHLKVSSNSLKFNPQTMFEICDPWIKAYHLSDNNGLSDTNEPFSEDAWFWDFLKKDINYYSIEVYNKNIEDLVRLRNMTKKILF